MECPNIAVTTVATVATVAVATVAVTTVAAEVVVVSVTGVAAPCVPNTLLIVWGYLLMHLRLQDGVEKVSKAERSLAQKGRWRRKVAGAEKIEITLRAETHKPRVTPPLPTILQNQL